MASLINSSVNASLYLRVVREQIKSVHIFISNLTAMLQVVATLEATSSSFLGQSSKVSLESSRAEDEIECRNTQKKEMS